MAKTGAGNTTDKRRLQRAIPCFETLLQNFFLRPNPHKTILCGKFSVTKIFARVQRQQMLCWKLVCLWAWNDYGLWRQNRRNHCQPLSMWQISMTGRGHEQTFKYDIFSLPHKNWRASFSANAFVTKFGQILSCIRANKDGHWKTCHW